jgi:hypothetical protein
MSRAEIVKRLARDLGLESGNVPPWAYKIAAILEGGQLAYLDALRDQAPRGGPWTGEVVAWTDHRVIRMRIKDASEDSGTRVTTWGRRPLQSLRIEGPDEYWADLNDGIAPGTQLRLEYPEQRALVIPLDPTIRSRTGELADLLPSLLQDLSG